MRFQSPNDPRPRAFVLNAGSSRTAQATSHQPPSPTKPNAILKVTLLIIPEHHHNLLQALDDPIPIVDLRYVPESFRFAAIMELSGL